MLQKTEQISKTRLFLIMSLFALLLMLFRISWIYVHQAPKEPVAKNGVINFQDVNLTAEETYLLDGTWNFSPHLFIQAPSINSETTKAVQLPHNWINDVNSDEQSGAYGFGTYQLKILLPKNRPELLSFRFSEVLSSVAVYIDGKLVSQMNQPHVKNSMTEKYGTFSVPFSPDQDEVELTLHVSNHELPFIGGITDSVWFGSTNAIQKETSLFSVLQMIVSVIYFLHVIYVFSLVYFGKGQHKKTLLYFGFMLATVGFTNLIDDNVIIHLPIPIEWYYRLLYLFFLTTLISMLYFIKSLYILRDRFFAYFLLIYGLFSIAFIIVPISLFHTLAWLANIFVIIAVIFMLKLMAPITQRRDQGSIIILLFIVSYGINVVWGMLLNDNLIEMPYYPFDFLLMNILIAFVLLQRYAHLLNLNKQQTKALQTANKQKDVFLMNTSHELRNPLHAMMNIGQSILDKDSATLSSNNKYHLKLLVRVGQQMSYMLHDLVDLTRLKDERITLKRKEIDLHAIISGLIDMIAFLIEGKKIQINVYISPSFPKLYADENRLLQILFNLLHNAVKFTNEGEITIEAKQKGKMAMIQVKDTGIGMSEQTTEKVFQPYVQENRPETNNGGIGIGLSICKKLIELHGGTIRVTSKLYKGSTFFFTIPIAHTFDKDDHETVGETLYPAPSVIQSDCGSAIASSIDNERQRILLIDDDSVNLKVLYNILSTDYEVATAYSGETALQCIEIGKFDLIICDVMMPNMSGYELTQTVRQRYSLSELPILLLTARQQFEDIYAGFLAGANDYIAKPAQILELRARVRALTELKKSINDQLKTEAAWLQAQIQPHFLFNTLNTIASLGSIDTSRMVTLLHEFGNYLRLSFGIHNTQTLIHVEDELKLTRSYLYIEQERFGDRLKIEWEITEDSNFQILPLSIQPIVENAVKHGVLQRMDGGKVTIRITKLETYYEIAIIDDGVGMKEDKVESLLEDSSSKSKGIGLANTNRRFKQMFGKGLIIISEPDEGTTVIMEIPFS
ncbi:ATP-binding protein [Virgibacillus sp. Bac330]|uniref:hybrid sensor histidine kinase/response regulator n=1 Tax=Virgibacillus sp. Bac330 TaxID=2419841 RepID=UPI000EF49A99|nr:ATP-binding protein [Virgibacillus sp. Bac330]